MPGRHTLLWNNRAYFLLRPASRKHHQYYYVYVYSLCHIVIYYFRVSHPSRQPPFVSAIFRVSHLSRQPPFVSATLRVSHLSCQPSFASAIFRVSHLSRQPPFVSAIFRVSHLSRQPSFASAKILFLFYYPNMLLNHRSSLVVRILRCAI